MNQNLEKLRLNDVEDVNLEVKQPSSNFYINEHQENQNDIYKFITNINDIPKIINNLNDENIDKINMIFKDNDLTKCCIELIDARYIPKIKFQANRITYIFVNLIK